MEPQLLTDSQNSWLWGHSRSVMCPSKLLQLGKGNAAWSPWTSVDLQTAERLKDSQMVHYSFGVMKKNSRMIRKESHCCCFSGQRTVSVLFGILLCLLCYRSEEFKGLNTRSNLPLRFGNSRLEEIQEWDDLRNPGETRSCGDGWIQPGWVSLLFTSFHVEVLALSVPDFSPTVL